MLNHGHRIFSAQGNAAQMGPNWQKHAKNYVEKIRDIDRSYDSYGSRWKIYYYSIEKKLFMGEHKVITLK